MKKGTAKANMEQMKGSNKREEEMGVDIIPDLKEKELTHEDYYKLYEDDRL